MSLRISFIHSWASRQSEKLKFTSQGRARIDILILIRVFENKNRFCAEVDLGLVSSENEASSCCGSSWQEMTWGQILNQEQLEIWAMMMINDHGDGGDDD